MKLWRWYLRLIDVRVLWPQVLEQAGGDRALAFSAWRAHMVIDPAYRGMTPEEKNAFLERLP